MCRLLAALLAVAVCTATFAEDKPKGEKLDLGTFGGHFEKNNSGLKGDASFLLLPDFTAFEKVFGTVPPAGLGKNPGRKTVPVTKATFETSIVAAVVKRGDAITTYSDVAAYLDGDTVTVTYKAETGKPSSAKYASPLFVAVPKEKVKKVVFVENGKEVGTAK
jgi:hypothetical protein